MGAGLLSLALLAFPTAADAQTFGFPTQSPRPLSKPAQTPEPDPVPQEISGLIQTEELAPLAPTTPEPDPEAESTENGGDGAAPSDIASTQGDGDQAAETEGDGRFKTAPFKAPERVVAPELIASLPTISAGGAVLRQLDKLSGEILDVEIASGTEAQVARLRIEVEGCETPEDGTNQGTVAYLRIWDTKLPKAEAVFQGWMFAESPALSSMDHPRYDVWLISCSTRSAEASSGNN